MISWYWTLLHEQVDLIFGFDFDFKYNCLNFSKLFLFSNFTSFISQENMNRYEIIRNTFI